MRKSNATSLIKSTLTSKIGWFAGSVAVVAILFMGTIAFKGDSPAEGKTIFVSQQASGQLNGESWETAFNHPQDAFVVAEAGDAVWVAKGTYKAQSDTAFEIPEGVTVYGGFAGTESVLGERDALANPVIFTSAGLEYSVVGAEGAALDGIAVQGEILAAGLNVAPPAYAPGDMHEIKIKYDAATAPLNCQIISEGEEIVDVDVLSDGDSINANYIILKGLGALNDTELLVWVDLDNNGTNMPVAGYSNTDGDLSRENIEVNVNSGDSPSVVASAIQAALAGSSIFTDAATAAAPAGSTFAITYDNPGAVEDLTVGMSNHLFGAVTVQGDTVTAEELQISISAQDSYVILRGLGAANDVDLLVWVDLDDAGSVIPLAGYDNADGDATKQNQEVTTVASGMTAGQVATQIALALQSNAEVIAAYDNVLDVTDLADGDGITVSGDDVLVIYNDTIVVADVISPPDGSLSATVTTQGGPTKEISTVTLAAGDTLKDILSAPTSFTYDDLINNMTLTLQTGPAIDLDVTGYPTLVLTMPNATSRVDVLAEITDTLNAYSDVTATDDEFSTIIIENNTAGAAADITTTDPAVFDVAVTQQGGVLVKEVVTITASDIVVPTDTIDGDSFLVGTDGGTFSKIRVWFDVNNNGTDVTINDDERGLEISSIVNSDTLEEVAAKIAYRINLDSALSATVSGTVVTITTVDPLNAVADTVAGPGTVDYTGTHFDVVTTDATGNVANVTFDTVTQLSNSGPHIYVEGSVLTVVTDEVLGAQTFVGWRVEGGELLSTSPVVQYTLNAPVTLEAVYINMSDIIYVDANAGSDANGGTSWADAYLTVGYALAQEVLRDNPNDEIWIAAGNYPESIELTNLQRIYGGFIGLAQDIGETLGTANEDRRSQRYFATTVDGNYLPVNESILNQSPFILENKDNHIVTASDDSILDGVVVENGYASGGFPNDRGAGIFCTTGSPTVVNCIIRGNHADQYGGGLYALLGSPVVENCLFIDNMAYRGGASFADSLSFPTFKDTTFRENIAKDGVDGFWTTESAPEPPPSPGWGGAIFNQGAAMNIENCQFIDNYMNMCGDGGAIYLNSTDVNGNLVQITDTIFVGNKALMHVIYEPRPNVPNYKEILSFNHGFGGAIYNRGSSPVITNCQFGDYTDGSSNTSTRNGGAVCNASGSRPTYSECTFVNNHAFLRGGAVYNRDATTGGLFTNCTFGDNTAPYGGAVYNEGAQTQFVDSTFIANECYESQLLSWRKSSFVPGFMGSYAPIAASLTTVHFLADAIPDYFAGWSTTQGSGVMPIISEPLPDWFGITGIPGTPVSTLPDVDGYFGGYGGSIFNNDASPTFTSCAFSQHEAISGAAIYNGRALISLDPNVEVEGDEGTSGPTETAGGTVNIVNCNFTENHSLEKGGAVYMSKNYAVNMSGNTFGDPSDAGQLNRSGALDDPSLLIIQSPSVVPLRDVYNYTGSWTELPPLPVGRKRGRVVRVAEGDQDWLYFIGGVGWNRETYTDFMSAYIWKINLKLGNTDPLKQWIIVPDLLIPVQSGAAAYGGDGRIYIFGGYTDVGGNVPTDQVQVLNLNGGSGAVVESWDASFTMPDVRALHGATLVESVDTTGADWSRIHLLGGTSGVVWTYWIAGGAGAGNWALGSDPAPSYSLTYQVPPGSLGGLTWAASNGTSVYQHTDPPGNAYRTYKAIDNWGRAPFDPPLVPNRENRFVPLTGSQYTNRGAPFGAGYADNKVVVVGGALDAAGTNGLTETLGDTTEAETFATTTDAAWSTGPSYPALAWQQMGATSEGGSMHLAGGTGRVSPSAFGGALYNGGGLLTIKRSSFYNSMALGTLPIPVGSGGAIYSHNGGTLVLEEDSIIMGSLAWSNAGGVGSVGDVSLTVDEAHFENNHAGVVAALQSGGGIYHLGTPILDITDSTFDGNTCGLFGGAVYSNTVCNVLNSTFTNNSAFLTGLIPPEGGALDLIGGEVISSTFTGNYCDVYGGATDNWTGTAVFTGCEFYNNSAATGGAAWDGTYVSCVFRGNYAVSSGGAATAAELEDSLLDSNTCAFGSGGGASSCIATRTIFVDNTAPSGGGSSFGLHYECNFNNNLAGTGGAISGSGVTINSLIYQNSASASGGGAYVEGGGAFLDLIHCTITENNAFAAGGVYGFTNVNSEIEALVTLRNSIVWGNISDFLGGDSFNSLHEMLTDDAQFDILYTCIRGRENGGISDGTGNIGLSADDNPQFINPAAGNYRLSATSPCINIGTNDETVVGYIVDIDYDGNGRPNQLISDMGAYESLGNRPEIVVKGRGKEILNGDSTPDESDDTEFGFQDPNGHSNTVLTINTVTYPNTIDTATGATATSLVLASSASSIDDIYNGYLVEIISGTGTGEILTITDYVGSSRTATVSGWTVTPDTTSVYSIYLAADEIQLAPDASGTNDTYNGDIIRIVSGGGLGQERVIVDYDGATRIATVDEDWSTSISASTQYRIATTIAVAAGTSITLTDSASDQDDAYNGLYINLIDQREAVSGGVQAATLTTIQISPTAVATDDYYIGCTITITGGVGGGQEQIITDYDGTTRTVTTAAWATTPTTSSSYIVEPADDQARLIVDYDGTTKIATVDEAFVDVVVGTYQLYAGHWFTIENIGITDLELNDGGAGDSIWVRISQDGLPSIDFAVLQQPDYVIGTGDDTQFLIGYYPTVGGNETRLAQVLISNNDSDESLYIFAIGGDAVDPNPEIDIRGIDGSTIADGEINSDPIVGTDFGEINWRTGELTRVFEIHNIGGSDLQLTGDFTSYDSIRISGDLDDFTILTQPTNATNQSYPVAPGNSYSLEIHFDPSVIGQRKAVIEVYSDDSDESPYSFTVSGTGVGPQIKVISQSQELLNLNDLDLDGIAPDDTPDTPAAENFTHFGSVDLTVTRITNTYELINSGTQTLNLSNTPLVEIRQVTDPFNWPVDDAVIAALPLSTSFFVVDQPAESVPPQLRTSFSLRYEPASGVAESHYGIVRILSNDTTFHFRVSGTNTLGNLPPTAVITTDVSPNATTGLYVVTPPQIVQVYGSGSTDPEGQPLTYSWTQPEGPVVLPIASPSSADTSIDFTTAIPGKYTFRLTVTDPLSGVPPALSDSAEISFYVGNVPIFDVPEVIWENEGVVDARITTPTGAALGGAIITEVAGDTLNRVTVSSPTDVGGNFTITLTDNSVEDGDETVTLRASAAGITNDIIILVKDDEAALITILGNNNEIENGSTVTSAENFTYFGTVVPGGSASQRQFVIENGSPTTTLNLIDIAPPIGRYVSITGTNAEDFTVEYQPTGTVLPDGSNTFGIVFDPVGTTLGIREALVTVLSNDADKSPYTYVIKGNRGQSSEIDVRYQGISIASESATPSTGNGTLFPTLAVGNDPITNEYTILNQGELLLTLTGNPVIYLTGDHEADFTLDFTGIDTTLGNAGSTTFTISFTPSAEGERNATVWIPNSDTDEDPYWFNIRGNGFGIATESPEIEVLGNNIVIASGAQAIIDNGTDYGTLEFGDTLTRTFTIRNVSPDSQLTLGTITSNEAIFTIDAQPADPTLDNGESTTFSVTCTPLSTEGITGTIRITNNDPDESPFNLILDVNGGNDGGDDSAGDGGAGGCSLGLSAGTGSLLPVLLILLGMIGTRLQIRRKK